MKGKQKERQPGVRYRECLRNYALSHGDALSQGRQVRDGCCEFTPGGPEGTAEYFLCEACRCHRNFHRAETEGQIAYESCYHRGFPGAPGNCWMDPSPTIAVSPAVNPLPTAAMALPVTALAIRPGEEYAGACHSSVSAQENSGKKRFRTKLTAEQKGRMLSFSERVGWKIQKYADAEIEQFCREIGVERKVLRVWMHNNKHVFTKPLQPSSWAQNATAMAQPSAWAQDATARAYNNADQAYDNSETTATNSTSNNDSTQSERDFQ